MSKRLQKLRKERQKTDKIRRKCQTEYDEYMNRKARKFKKCRNVLLWAESAMVFSKVGKNVMFSVVRQVYRTITDPRNTVNAIKTLIKDPKKRRETCKNVFLDSGTLSALKRVKISYSLMPRVKQAKDCLERYGPTNYVTHM